jgi:hypothetical protein
MKSKGVFRHIRVRTILKFPKMRILMGNHVHFLKIERILQAPCAAAQQNRG